MLRMAFLGNFMLKAGSCSEQSPRRVLASRRLLLAAVGMPRFDPRPRRKRGRGSKRGDEAPVGRCLL
jgi:hypothetical protein